MLKNKPSNGAIIIRLHNDIGQLTRLLGQLEYQQAGDTIFQQKIDKLKDQIHQNIIKRKQRLKTEIEKIDPDKLRKLLMDLMI